MLSNIPGFLATPYDDCTFFQSRSRELVVFSPSVGEYVTIGWYVLSFDRRYLAKVYLMAGQPITVVGFFPTESRSGFEIGDYIGPAFAV